MRQAIVTKFLPVTNSRGSRVKATCEAGSITLGWDHALNVAENHRAACDALLAKQGWEDRKFEGGWLPTGGCVFVDID